MNIRFLDRLKRERASGVSPPLFPQQNYQTLLLNYQAQVFQGKKEEKKNERNDCVVFYDVLLWEYCQLSVVLVSNLRCRVGFFGS